jgi:hypothetical protein
MFLVVCEAIKCHSPHMISLFELQLSNTNDATDDKTDDEKDNEMGDASKDRW